MYAGFNAIGTGDGTYPRISPVSRALDLQGSCSVKDILSASPVWRGRASPHNAASKESWGTSPCCRRQQPPFYTCHTFARDTSHFPAGPLVKLRQSAWCSWYLILLILLGGTHSLEITKPLPRAYRMTTTILWRTGLFSPSFS